MASAFLVSQLLQEEAVAQRSPVWSGAHNGEIFLYFLDFGKNEAYFPVSENLM